MVGAPGAWPGEVPGTQTTDPAAGVTAPLVSFRSIRPSRSAGGGGDGGTGVVGACGWTRARQATAARPGRNMGQVTARSGVGQTSNALQANTSGHSITSRRPDGGR